MSDERDKEGQPQGFKVSDRRKRYEEQAETTAAPPPAEAPPTPLRAAEQPAAEAAGAGAGAEADLHGAEAGHGVPGPADFLQLVVKIYQDGLAFMGMFDDPQAGQSLVNFPIAGWHIDILGILEEKTKGNLTEEEAKLLKEAIANLKMTFVRASGSIKH